MIVLIIGENLKMVLLRIILEIIFMTIYFNYVPCSGSYFAYATLIRTF